MHHSGWSNFDDVAPKRLRIALNHERSRELAAQRTVEVGPGIVGARRVRYRMRGRTKYSSLLKHQIPIRTFAD